MPAFAYRLLACIALAAVLTPVASHAQSSSTLVIGDLEVQWGDGLPGVNHQVSQLRVNLVEASDHRSALDPIQAKRAAGDLYMMASKKVGASFSRATLVQASQFPPRH